MLASTKSVKQNDREKTKTDEGNFIISGRVISSDKQKPIAATVSFVTILKVYTTQTDKDGNYSLEVPKKILKYESLLDFSPEDYIYDRKLPIYTIKNLGKKQSVGLDYNGLDKMMGDIVLSPPNATEKSLVILDGKKIDPELFNKSYWMHYNRYDLYYIPREFVKFFTDKESIKDLYIVFVKPEQL
nr:carboxypeptidase-like regulatory domain-containing protein [uncultured Chryseobacterium sp.]